MTCTDFSFLLLPAYVLSLCLGVAALIAALALMAWATGKPREKDQ